MIICTPNFSLELHYGIVYLSDVYGESENENNYQ